MNNGGEFTLALPEPEQTLSLGALIADSLLETSRSASIFLLGDLGAGKTTLTKGILRRLGHIGNVKSPTYTLVEPYELDELTVYHFDLYRLADPEELECMGIRDYFDQRSLCLVEWPEKGQGFLPRPDLQIRLQVIADHRNAELTALSLLGQTLLNCARRRHIE
ncbi:MAG: tRNA (adenosine(37)-N6)-threonylcarbamoyltransferase complex ATPase subunit type 1 TsaE [Gammaproteobacteria bacterium]|nr:MAG: tRNA (adenosine(37)-N6)-threonylcarbamoyltransferase complex ATPase subunit type 1 TsaE [Gammaproteobacteria bacterium]